jgi:thiol-disulfide isomerase/thioredoxin
MAISQWIPAAAALVSALLPAARPAELPRKAPDYAINLPGGKTLPLSQYKGHAVVMAFILTTCPHCQRTIGFLIKDQNEYGPRGLQVLASAIDQGAEMALPLFLRNFQPTFPVGYNTPDSAGAFMQPSKMPMMPLLAFIDRQGIIRAQYEGEDPFFNDLEQNLRKEIESLLQGGATGRKGTAAPKKATGK